MAGRLRAPEHQRTLKTCWALGKGGKPCPHPPTSNGLEEKGPCGWLYIPYCEHHLKVGDEAVKVLPHPTLPFLGNILLATRDLPAGYRFAYWGERKRTTGKAMRNDDRAIDFQYGRKLQGLIDPGPFAGSVLQFAASPGPDEWPNMVVTAEHFGTMKGTHVGMMYNLVWPVTKGHQVLHQYGAGWFSERDIKPINVGTPEYPVPQRLAKQGVSMTFSGKFAASLAGAKKSHLGTFATEEEAMRAYETAVQARAAEKAETAKPRARAQSGGAAKRSAVAAGLA